MSTPRPWPSCVYSVLFPNVLEQSCVALAAQFGQTHGLTQAALLPILLTASPPASLKPSDQHQSRSIPLADRILETFQPHQGDLSAWVVHWVHRHPPFKTVLLNHGLYHISDWTVLNHVTQLQVERILNHFHCLSDPDVRQLTQLLVSYQAVCRHDYRYQRQGGANSHCPAPL